MFEMYVRNIDPDEEGFQSFISKYVTNRGVKDPEATPYYELYNMIKEGIREYMRQQHAGAREKK